MLPLPAAVPPTVPAALAMARPALAAPATPALASALAPPATTPGALAALGSARARALTGARLASGAPGAFVACRPARSLTAACLASAATAAPAVATSRSPYARRGQTHQALLLLGRQVTSNRQNVPRRAALQLVVCLDDSLDLGQNRLIRRARGLHHLC